MPLSQDQLLLKGSCLRNTEWIYGVAAYTGHQTKVMNNSLKSRSKKSKVDKQTNYYIIVIVLIQFSVCIFAGIYTNIWQQYRGMSEFPYMEFTKN